MSFGLRPCILQGWAVCEGNCEECGTTATTTTDGFWYHGNGKLGGEFHPNKPNDEEHYGEYVKIVRCKDCVYWKYDDCQNDNHGYCPTNENDFCPWGERKYEVEVVHNENCKYEDTGGGMTNRQYLATLSNEELSNVIYDVIVDRIGHRYSSSRQGVSQWLGELYREDDFKKGFVYYADNKKIMEDEENEQGRSNRNPVRYEV